MSVHTLVSSGTYLIVKGSLSEVAPLVFAFYRFCIASVLFFGIKIVRGHYFPFERSQWPLLILLGALAIPFNQCLFIYGMNYTLPTHPALLFATTPVWVYMLSIWRGEEKMSGVKTAGILTALAGVMAFFIEKGFSLKLDYLLGDMIILLAVWSWSSYTVLGRPLVQRKGAMVVTSSTLIIGTLMYFPLGLYFALEFDYSSVTWIGWGGIAYAAVLTSGLAYTIWYWCIKHMEPSRTAVFMNLQPVLTAILAYYLMAERLSAGSIVSGLVILVGVFVVQRS
jgi:drug/metabolite transporter (DMT)-like permease